MISFTNNGGIRADFPVGNITYEDVLTVQPFDNIVDLVTMTGEGLERALEEAAATLDYDNIESGYPGFGYQVAGLKFTVIVSENNAGSRIRDLEVKNVDGTYSDVDYKKVGFPVLDYFVSTSLLLSGIQCCSAKLPGRRRIQTPETDARNL